MTLDVNAITPLFIAGLTLLNGWVLWLVAGARKDRTDQWREIYALRQELSEHKEKVAREHVTFAALERVEERVIQAIERLAVRLDGMFQHTRS